MRNADMPAMPIFDDCGRPAMYGVDGVEALGLTKREMIAMHMAAGNMAARTVQWADVNVPLMARIAVDMADALLAELERTK